MTNLPWDDGIRWHLEQVEAPDVANDDTLSLAVVRDDHLRGANGTAEDDYLRRLLKVTYAMAERHTWRAHLQQTWDLVLSGFPTVAAWGYRIEFPKPPLQEVTSIIYIDGSGDEQELLSSPSDVQIVKPSGPKAAKGYITPLYGASWPSVLSSTPEAIRIRFVAGYPLNDDSPASAMVPEDIDQGRLLVIGEMYKTRSESAIGTSPALHLAKDLWREYRAW
jgi:uncharacterized phiE125 gp8 family phage protein